MRISCFSAAVLIGGFEGLAISGYLHILIMVRGFLRSRGRITTMTLAITCRRFSPSLGPET